MVLEDDVPEGVYCDPLFPSVFYLPENATFSLRDQKISWSNNDDPKTLALIPENSYVLPSGYKVEMKKTENDGPWKLVGTVGEGFLCHKPCTVSGGGKSVISKPLTDAIVCGPVFIADWEGDMKLAREVINKDYSDRFRDPKKSNIRNRTVLDETVTRSVIKLLTPSQSLYTEEFNTWLESSHRGQGLVSSLKEDIRRMG